MDTAGVGEKKKSSSGGGKSLLWNAAVRNKPNVLNANVRDATYPRRRPGFVVFETVFATKASIRGEMGDAWLTMAGWLQAVTENSFLIYYIRGEKNKPERHFSEGCRNTSRSISRKIDFNIVVRLF